MKYLPCPICEIEPLGRLCPICRGQLKYTASIGFNDASLYQYKIDHYLSEEWKRHQSTEHVPYLVAVSEEVIEELKEKTQEVCFLCTKIFASSVKVESMSDLDLPWKELPHSVFARQICNIPEQYDTLLAYVAYKEKIKSILERDRPKPKINRSIFEKVDSFYGGIHPVFLAVRTYCPPVHVYKLSPTETKILPSITPPYKHSQSSSIHPPYDDDEYDEYGYGYNCQYPYAHHSHKPYTPPKKRAYAFCSAKALFESDETLEPLNLFEEKESE